MRRASLPYISSVLLLSLKMCIRLYYILYFKLYIIFWRNTSFFLSLLNNYESPQIRPNWCDQRVKRWLHTVMTSQWSLWLWLFGGPSLWFIYNSRVYIAHQHILELVHGETIKSSVSFPDVNKTHGKQISPFVIRFGKTLICLYFILLMNWMLFNKLDMPLPSSSSSCCEREKLEEKSMLSFQVASNKTA